MKQTYQKKRVIFALLLTFLLCGFSDTEDNYFINVSRDMVLIDEGLYRMGAEEGDLYASETAKPIHTVDLNPYTIDLYEVTNQEYAECVSAGKCQEPSETDSATRSDYYPDYAHFPVVNITWQDASDYCAYVGKRLPTEAEWEKAARGTTDYRRYSWGSGSPRDYLMNIGSTGVADTEQVNSHTAGYSPYGVADMTANVSEWVSDWYSADYYSVSPTKNPAGPDSGTQKVVRGDSFASSLTSIHITNRIGMDPEEYSSSVGFRCVQDLQKKYSYDQTEAEEETTEEDETQLAVVSAGNSTGIFILKNPGGSDNTLIRVVSNGGLVEIIAGPVEINYSKWYRVRTMEGQEGWTIGTALTFE